MTPRGDESVDELITTDLEAALESLIFMSNEPLTPEKMVDALSFEGNIFSLSDIKLAVKSLQKKWSDPSRAIGRGMVLVKAAQGYQFASAPEQAVIIKRVVSEKPTQLTRAQLEVLSIAAYRQPVTRVDVDEIRGVDSSFALKKLMQYKLLKILGKSEGLGRPLLYGTSKYFLEFFSLNSLNDLPTLKQFDSLDSGEEQEKVDLDDDRVSVKDLFKEGSNGSMFSEEVQNKSDEALLGLDEALLRIDSVQKNLKE